MTHEKIEVRVKQLEKAIAYLYDAIRFGGISPRFEEVIEGIVNNGFGDDEDE